jgi:metallopeptidase YgjP-like protein
MMIRPVPGGFEVFIPRWLRKDNPRVRAFIESGIKKLGAKVIPLPTPQISRDDILAMVNTWSARMGVHPRRVQFREMTRKWGSCSSTENITLNTRLTWLSPHLAEYVVCHELVHLRVFHHGKEFKAMLSSYMPDWEERDRELNAINFAGPLAFD